MAEQQAPQQTPCPLRLLDDTGGAFAMGCVGGAVWQMFKGWRQGAEGRKMYSIISNMRMHAPRTGCMIFVIALFSLLLLFVLVLTSFFHVF
jgi:import inner membrane translocase subunit TIM17